MLLTLFQKAYWIRIADSESPQLVAATLGPLLLVTGSRRTNTVWLSDLQLLSIGLVVHLFWIDTFSSFPIDFGSANVWVTAEHTHTNLSRAARIKLIQSTSKTLFAHSKLLSILLKFPLGHKVDFWKPKKLSLSSKVFAQKESLIKLACQIRWPREAGATGAAGCRFRAAKNKTRLLELQSVWQLHSLPPKATTTPFRLELIITHFAR